MSWPPRPASLNVLSPDAPKSNQNNGTPITPADRIRNGFDVIGARGVISPPTQPAVPFMNRARQNPLGGGMGDRSASAGVPYAMDSNTAVPWASNPPPEPAPPPLSPGTAIPGAKGPTSIGSPSGPTPLMPPENAVSPAPVRATPRPTPLHFAPDVPQKFRPFTVQDPSLSNASGPQHSEIAATPTRRVSTMFPNAGPLEQNLSSRSIAPFRVLGGQPNAPSRPPMSFPLEALLAPDRNRALDQWASSKPRSAGGRPAPSVPTPNVPALNLSAPSPPAPSMLDQGAAPISYVPDPTQDAPGGILRRLAQMNAFDPSDPDRAPAGGLLALLQEYMRNSSDRGARR